MKPMIADDASAEGPAKNSPGTTASLADRGPRSPWLARMALALGLVAVALLGFGSSVGWFDFAQPQKTAGLLEDTIQQPSPEAANVAAVNSGDASGTSRTKPPSGVTAPAANLPPLAALIPEQSLALIDECRRVALHLRQLFPTSLDAREMHARFEFELGDIEKARSIWAENLQVDPQNAAALRGLGDICTINGELKEAVTYFRRAVLADPEDITRQITLGVALLQAAQVDEATEILKGVLLRRPQHVGAHAELGRAYLQLQDYQSARTHFEAALQDEKQLADPGRVHVGLATALRRLGEDQLAKDHVLAHDRLRKEHTAQRQAGRRDYDDVAAIRIDVGRLYVDMARVYLAGGQPEAAELLLLRASQMNSQDVDSRQALAYIAMQQGQLHSAIRWLREVWVLRPSDFSIVREIARLYVELQMPQSAEKILLEYLEYEPQSPAAFTVLTEFYVNVQRNLEQAEHFASANVAVAPTAENHSTLAIVHEAAGNNAAAIESLKRAAALEPANPTYSQRLALLRDAQE